MMPGTSRFAERIERALAWHLVIDIFTKSYCDFSRFIQDGQNEQRP